MAGPDDAHYTHKPPSGALKLSRLDELIKQDSVIWMVFPSSTWEYREYSGLPIRCQLDKNCGRVDGPGTRVNVGGNIGSYYSDKEYLCYGFGSVNSNSLRSAWGFENYWFALAYALRKKAERE